MIAIGAPIILAAALSWQLGDVITFTRWCDNEAALVESHETDIGSIHCWTMTGQIALGVMIEEVRPYLNSKRSGVGSVWRITMTHPRLGPAYIFVKPKSE